MKTKKKVELFNFKDLFMGVLAYIWGIFYSFYAFDMVNITNMIYFFFMFTSLHCGLVLIKAYMDYYRLDWSKEYKELKNPVQDSGLSPTVIRYLIIVCISISCVLGVVLLVDVSIVLLICWMAFFIVALLMASGRKPFYNPIFEEFNTALFYGGLIPFFTVFFNANLLVEDGLRLVWVILPIFLMVFGFSLMKNMYFLDIDIENNYYTLPSYFSEQYIFDLYKGSFWVSFILMTISVLGNYMPWTVIFVWIISFKVFQNIKFCLEYYNTKLSQKLAFESSALVLSFYILATLIGLFF